MREKLRSEEGSRFNFPNGSERRRTGDNREDNGFPGHGNVTENPFPFNTDSERLEEERLKDAKALETPCSYFIKTLHIQS